MRVLAEPPDVIHLVARRLARTELRSGDIHSIGTAVYCCDADLVISCRSKQFKLLHRLEGLELLLCTRTELRVCEDLLVVNLGLLLVAHDLCCCCDGVLHLSCVLCVR